MPFREIQKTNFKKGVTRFLYGPKVLAVTQNHDKRKGIRKLSQLQFHNTEINYGRLSKDIPDWYTKRSF